MRLNAHFAIAQFQRISFYLSHKKPSKRVFLIVYFGNETVTRQISVHIITHKKVLEKIPKIKSKPLQRIYANFLAKSEKQLSKIEPEKREPYESTKTSRNPKQIKNKLYREKKESVNKDVVFRICELSRNFEDFIQQYTIFDEDFLICSKLPEYILSHAIRSKLNEYLLSTKELMIYGQNLIDFSQVYDEIGQVYSIDTTFYCEQVYVTMLTIRNVFPNNSLV